MTPWTVEMKVESYDILTDTTFIGQTQGSGEKDWWSWWWWSKLQEPKKKNTKGIRRSVYYCCYCCFLPLFFLNLHSRKAFTNRNPKNMEIPYCAFVGPDHLQQQKELQLTTKEMSTDQQMVALPSSSILLSLSVSDTLAQFPLDVVVSRAEEYQSKKENDTKKRAFSDVICLRYLAHSQLLAPPPSLFCLQFWNALNIPRKVPRG